MHRSRPTVLVIFAAVAACSTHDDANTGNDLLAQDRTLVARLETARDVRQAPLPAACGTVAVATKPADANQTQAKQLTLQAQGEEMKGNIAEARTLLLRATALDGTNQSAAYHLGRTNEALGDRSAAMAAYCRYLALTPSSSESAEARQRVTELAQPVTRVSTGSVSESASGPARRSVASTRAAVRERRTVTHATTPRSAVVQSAIATSPARANDAPRTSDAATTSREVGGTSTGSVAESGVGSTIDPVQTVDAPTPSRAERRGPTRTQGAILGAGMGAIIGAATSRSVKGAVIGAAAGGLLGTVVTGRGSRLRGPGIR